MNIFKIPMTWEEFEVCEVPFGWKEEYFNGFAYITPRSHGVMMKIAIKKRQVIDSVEIKPISETSKEQLSKLFYSTFVKSVEYLGRTKYSVKKSSIEEINDFFAGERGIPQFDLCKIAFLKNKLVGACLVSKYKFGYKDEILFVHPKHQRKGIGNALVSSILNDLFERGEKVFWSEHHICNELSASWHRKFGFAEVTDITTARLRRNYYNREIYRQKHFGNLEKVAELKKILKTVEAEVVRLKKIEDKDFGAAWLSWKYDY
jgi:GNAT superfamily N-acetyltransferase